MRHEFTTTESGDRTFERPPPGYRGDWGWAWTIDEGDRVPVTPSVTAFAALFFEVDFGAKVGYRAFGQLRLDSPPSRYVLDSFTVARRPDGPAVTTIAVRSIAIESLVKTVLDVASVESPYHRSPLSEEGGEQMRQAGLKDDTALQFVADVYLSASLRGDPATEWVALELECSKASAGRWIAAAKDAGFLKTATLRRRD